MTVRALPFDVSVRKKPAAGRAIILPDRLLVDVSLLMQIQEEIL
jgi:hypothetical protein